jgi:hypothetical protein
MVKIRCKRCTKFFERGGTQKILCYRCGYTKKIRKDKFCNRCKKIIVGRSNSAWLCIPCMEKYRNFPKCKICNKSIQDKKRNSRYCKKCSENKLKEYGKEYRKNHKKIKVKK